MPTYYLWNIGCQMNKAESEHMASYVEGLGFLPVARPEQADLVLLNTCVVRGNAEQRVIGELAYLKGLKARRPGMSIVVTGCFVDSTPDRVKADFRQVDVAFPAGEFAAFERWVNARMAGHRRSGAGRPAVKAGSHGPTAYVPVVRGCNNFCSYCIVPYRRGRERSRPPQEVVSEVERLVRSGVREVTLLGQNINSYGRDLPGRPDLAGLLAALDGVPGLLRIRFLTSHPRDVDQKFIDALASLDRVCRHISLPAQAGDDRVLQAMRRGYTSGQYRDLVRRLRQGVPDLAISTDIIVGFPGESGEEFRRTAELVSELRFDTVHVAAYSPRPGTLAQRTMADDVPTAEKERRLRMIEEMQQAIAAELNRLLAGQRLEVLVEGKSKGKWHGRTGSNKLVFFADDGRDWTGALVDVKVTSTSPWSLRGEPALGAEVASG